MPSRLARFKFSLVVQLQRKKLLGYAMRVCRNNEAEAEDLVQESLKAGFEALPGFRSVEEPVILAYLFMTMRNRFRTKCRKQLHELLGDGPHLVEPAQEEPDVATELWRLLDEDTLREAAEVLSKGEREAWDLRLKGLRYDEIAEALGKNRGTVGKLLFEARVKMSVRCRELLSRKLNNPKRN